MTNSKDWFSVKELIDKNLTGLPTSDKGIVKKATRDNWLKRQREGVKGKTFEYHYSSLPKDVQKQLGFNPVEVAATEQVYSDIRETEAHYGGDTVTVSKARLLTAITTLDEILDMTHKTMPAKARAQMVWMIYELLSEESANEKIINLVKLIA
ncbi:DNA-binding protein [Basfia succiniciproducens]|uniref:DNA-binding protein n=1 Tax=Basfia succiniciproducens TaxID=653940 RepID=UPI003FCEC47E